MNEVTTGWKRVEATGIAGRRIDSALAQKRNGQGDWNLPVAPPMREEEEESRETCLAAA
jgi:hypothetical protein